MDGSPGSDIMDWKEDSSLHIIQPASSPWRKRSFDTYNDTNEPYHASEAENSYRVTDTLRHHTELLEPYIDFNGRPAPYVTDFDGNVIQQPIIQPEPPKPIGYYLPEVVKWIIYGAVLLICGSCELIGHAYVHTATVAVQAGDSAKRRLVEVTRKAFAPPPPPAPRKRCNVPPHRRRSPLIRRVSPTSPGGRTHIPVTPSRARPTATIKEVAVPNNECIADYVPRNSKHPRSGAFVSSTEDDHLMSGVTHDPCYEPLMSGALQNITMDEDSQSTTPSSFSLHHIPGTFPYSPVPPVLPSTESPTPQSQASDRLTIPHDLNSETDSPTPQSQASDRLTVLHDVNSDDSSMSEDQAADELATSRSEASDESDIPDEQVTMEKPMQIIDSRPRNYKGELLDDWQIKVCREFQAIHPPPREIRQQATNVSEHPQSRNSIGSIDLHRSPLANGSLVPPHQQLGTPATGSIDSHRSPLLNGSPVTSSQQHETLAAELIDSRRSPMANVSQTEAADGITHVCGPNTELLHKPHGTISIGSNDSPRSPLDLQSATLETLRQPHGSISLGLNDLHRSPLTDKAPTRTGDVLKKSHDTVSDVSYHSPGMATTGLIDSPRSPLAEVSPINSLHGTSPVGSIDSPRSPLVDLSSIHLQLGMSPTGSIDLPRSPLAVSPMAEVDAMTDTHEAGPDIANYTQGAMPVLSTTPPTSPSAMMTTTPTGLLSKWSLRSLFSRVQGRPKKRSPLRERINNSNIHKVPKTPKKVTWPEKGPVTGTKRFVKHEAMSHPSPVSSREDSSILSSVPSDFSPPPNPTMQKEREQKEPALSPPYQVSAPISANDDGRVEPISSNECNETNSMSTIEATDVTHDSGEEQTISSRSSSHNEASVPPISTPTKKSSVDPSTPPSLSPDFAELTLSTRRSSRRQREKEDKAQKLRDAIAAEEKAGKDREEAEAKARKEKEEAEEKARIKAAEEEERKKTGGRRMPIERVIQLLPPEWDEKVRINMAKGMREQLALTSVGNPLTRRDFGMVLPQPGTGDDISGWLNDEIISGYLQAVVDHGHRAMGHPRGAKPRMHAFNAFFYTTLKERGYDGVKRWSSRAKIGGNDLKNVEYVFIPCNPTKSHWTLVVVSPVRKTIEVFDSMHGSLLDKVNTTKEWLKGEYGRSYVDSEWTVIEDPRYSGCGKGPTQNNVNDCGVFTVTTAKMLVLGVDPMAVSAADMPLQRRRVVAELLNGGFSGELEPRVVFE